MNFLKLIVSHNLFLIYLQHTTRLKPPPIPPLAKDRVVASMPSIQPNTIEPFQIAEAFFTDVAQPYCLLRRTSECYITLSVGMTQHCRPTTTHTVDRTKPPVVVKNVGICWHYTLWHKNISTSQTYG